MCSGLTAYAALKRLDRPRRARAGAAGRPRRRRDDGACAGARAICGKPPLVADIAPGKREAALAAGAAGAFDPADPGARKAVLAARAGGVNGACDFVGSDEASSRSRPARSPRAARSWSPASSAAATRPPPRCSRLRAMTIEGVLTGTLAEAHELMALARGGGAPAFPMRSARWLKRRPRSTICAPAASSAARC